MRRRIMNKDQNGGNFMIGFFLGGLVGGFIIFLMGTKEGKKIVERLIEKTEIYEEELEEKVEDLQKKGEDLLAQAQEVKEKLSSSIAGGKNKVSESLVTKMDEALTKIEDIQKKGVSLTEEVHKNYFKKNGRSLSS
jgi:gas vesicle protein